MSGVNRRKAIREKVIELLQNAEISGIGDKVFSGQVRRLWADEVPCILVYTRSEPARPAGTTPTQYRRDLLLAVEVVYPANSGLEDALDDTCAAIETVIATQEADSDPLEGEVADIQQVGTEISLSGEGEKQVGAARITYQVAYFT